MSDRLLMIRHGESEARYKGRYIGKTDAALSADGQKQAAALAAPLSAFGGTSLFTSPLRRARQTAELALGQNRGVQNDENLREVDFGLWEGMSFAEISALYPAEVARWAVPGEDFTFPEGESTKDFRKRIATAADRIVKDPAEKAVVFTHGGVIRFLICHFLGLPDRCHLSFEISPASLSEIMIFDGKGILTRLNDRRHLNVL